MSIESCIVSNNEFSETLHPYALSDTILSFCIVLITGLPCLQCKQVIQVHLLPDTLITCPNVVILVWLGQLFM